MDEQGGLSQRLWVVLSGRLISLSGVLRTFTQKVKGFWRIALKVYTKIPITEEPVAVGLVSCYRGLMPKLRKNTYAMRFVAGQPAERILPPGSFAGITPVFPAGVPLSSDEKIRVLVWNIFKQQRAEWKSVLNNFGKDAHLVLLQEAQTTPELVKFATSNYLAADQVPALVLPQHPSGVMTLASAHPIYCCPLREREPILRLAKSALVTVYPLPDSRLLMVVNIHAVNFSIGVDVYSKQLLPIGDQIARHSGPVIMAGDFNAWSRPRMNALYRFAREMSLREVRFPDDQRRRAFGRPLDFVFYRGLNVHDASVLVTSASDHNPLLVEFNPGKPD